MTHGEQEAKETKESEPSANVVCRFVITPVITSVHLYTVQCTVYTCTLRVILRVILNMLLVIDSLTVFGSPKYEYREYTKHFFFNLGQYCTCETI